MASPVAPSDRDAGPPSPQAKTGETFISYAREDMAFVRELFDSLQARNHGAWVDWEIYPSTEWMQAILAAIDAAPAVVTVLSPDAVASPICRQELEHAVAQHKRLVPIVCREIDPATVPDALRRLQWISFVDRSAMDATVDHLVDVLDTDLAARQAHARLLVRAREWQEQGRDRSVLLRGRELQDFERRLACADGESAPRPTALQSQFLLESRRAESRRLHRVIGAGAIALAVTAALAVYASMQSRSAAHQRDVAVSRLLAAQALRSSTDPFGRLDLALLLGVAARRIQPTLEAERSLHAALIETNRLERIVRAGDTLVSLALSPDGGLVATGSFHGGITVRDARTYETQAAWRIAPPGNPRVFLVRGLAFSPDGRTLASAAGDQVDLWDPRTGALRRTLEGVPRGVEHVAWRADGTALVATGRGDRRLVVWDPATGKRRAEHPHDPVQALALSPDGHAVAIAGARRNEVEFAALEGEGPTTLLRGHEAPVRALAFSPDGGQLASAGEDATVIVWEVATGARRLRLEGQAGRINGVAFSPDGRWLAAASQYRTIVLWDLATGSVVDVLRGHDNDVTAVAFTPDGGHLVSIAFSDALLVWNAGLPQQRATLYRHEGDVRSVVVSADGRLLASAGADRNIRLWDLAAQKPRATLSGHRDTVRALAFSPDGQRLASGSEDHRVMLWEVGTGRRTAEIRGPPITALAYSPDGRFVAAGGDTLQGVLVWPVDEGERAIGLSGTDASVTTLAFDREGRLLAGDGAGPVRVFDPAAGKAVGPLAAVDAPASRLALSPADRLLAAAAPWPDSLALWDLRGRHPPVELDTMGSHAAPVFAFSPDGRRLAYGAGETGLTIVLWDVAASRVLALLEAEATPLSLAFTGDGKGLIAGQYGGAVVQWDVDLDHWADRACAIANRNLTRDEWRTFVGEGLAYRAVCQGLPLPEASSASAGAVERAAPP